ncbi:ABC transporter permease [Mycoplasma sp. HU2014]|uniref:ABC transporter permease n=1 Tax=Mycoplasma sp. HU2014 TaxID=1664275 RepID=UPI00067C2D5F|nr:ABC transporter permease [Mycoplasma sp. HU2014]KNG79202.1 putative sugar ABC transporter permease [Mycoplasma sp. HU2014]
MLNSVTAQWAFGFIAILLFASLSALVSEKAGVVNIAVEGMMTVGALVVSILGTIVNTHPNEASSQYTQIWVMLLAAIVTSIFSLLHAFPSVSLKSNQIVSGTAINILALGTGIFLASSNYFGKQSQIIASGYTTLKFGPFPVWMIVAIIVAILLLVFFKYTKQGMRYAMVGENPNAIDAAGISVTKYRYIAVMFSGFLAGIGGGAFILTIVGSGTFGGSLNGYGFLAIAIMIFGQWKIPFISIGVIIFSMIFAMAQQISLLFDQNVIKRMATLFKVTPFVLTIIGMIAFSKTSRAPAAVGVPFDKSKR